MRALLTLLVLTVSVALAYGADGAGTDGGKPGTLAECVRNLAGNRSQTLVCTVPLRPTAAERAAMEQQTAGYIKNADCTLSVAIERALVHGAIGAADTQFDAPPQPVACTVTMPGKAGPNGTEDTQLNITATFAPRITIRGGIAVAASPGLGNVAGVSRLIAIPAAAYINRAKFLQDGMIDAINAWLPQLRLAIADAH